MKTWWLTVNSSALSVHREFTLLCKFIMNKLDYLWTVCQVKVEGFGLFPCKTVKYGGLVNSLIIVQRFFWKRMSFPIHLYSSEHTKGPLTTKEVSTTLMDFFFMAVLIFKHAEESCRIQLYFRKTHPWISLSHFTPHRRQQEMISFYLQTFRTNLISFMAWNPPLFHSIQVIMGIPLIKCHFSVLNLFFIK